MEVRGFRLGLISRHEHAGGHNANGTGPATDRNHHRSFAAVSGDQRTSLVA